MISENDIQDMIATGDAFPHQRVTVVGMTYPTMEEYPHVTNIGEFIDHCARVSNPKNQESPQDTDRLLAYLIRNKHWSPFEMANITMKVETTRDIARQILRHRSFSFQEFSQRYAEVEDDFVQRDARLKDEKNRQNSIKTYDLNLINCWLNDQRKIAEIINNAYSQALKLGIAREQARAILPEGMTKSTLYMNGSVRSWIHYCDLRCGNGTQLEHMDVAYKILDCLIEEMPSMKGYFVEKGLYKQ